MAQVMTPTESALLLVFGDLKLDGNKVQASEILHSLLAQRIWLTPRFPAGLTLPLPALFYQSKGGAVGRATIVAVEAANDATMIPNLPIPSGIFRYVLRLSDAKTFTKPHPVPPIVGELSFVKEKRNWGTAFRTSPRLIPMDDFRRLAAD